MNFVKRMISLPRRQSFFLFGPRQCGKTTLLRERYSAEQILYYDLLRTDEYLRLTAVPSLLREEVESRSKNVRQVVIDEIQRIPLLLNEIHSMIERGENVQFILSGSSARKLKRTGANLLAGRALTYGLYPFTRDELGTEFNLRGILRFGSIPGVMNGKTNTQRAQILRSYVNTYLREEIEQESQLRRLDAFVRFFQFAAHENGRVLNFSNIARETATSSQTIRSYYEILEDTLLGFFLPAFSKSLRKRLAKHPKFYFFDTGVVRALTRKLNVPLEPKTEEYGRAFEHLFILEAHRLNQYLTKDYLYSYYRSEAGAEVDLIVETPRGKIIAIEIKGTDRISNPHLRGLRSFGSMVKGASLYCACLASKRRRAGNITILHWEDMMEILFSRTK